MAVRGSLHEPPRPSGSGLVLSHGAGSDSNAPLLVKLAGCFADAGVTDPADVDLWTAIQMGITGQQWANDPGGRRFADHIDAAVDMFLAHVKRKRRKAQP